MITSLEGGQRSAHWGLLMLVFSSFFHSIATKRLKLARPNSPKTITSCRRPAVPLIFRLKFAGANVGASRSILAATGTADPR